MNSKPFANKAPQNLAVAEWCFENGHYDACCNRAYYAMFQAALAALAQDNIHPPDELVSHSWVHGNFATHFCNRRKIFPRFREYLPNAQFIRNRADYRPDSVTYKQAQQQLEKCKAFVATLLKRIKSYDDV